MRAMATMVGLAFSAVSAQGALIDINLRLSRDGVTWTDVMNDAMVGETIHCAIFMNSSEPERIYGIAGATLRLTGVGTRAGDAVAFAPGTATGRVSPFAFGAATNMIFSSADGFRIDAMNDPGNTNPSAGLTFFQRDPATAAPGSFQILPAGGAGSKVFAFDLTLGSNDVYDIMMGMDQLSRDVASYYDAPGASRPSRTADVTMTGAILRVNVPSPGAAIVLTLGVVMKRRERSRANG